MRAKITIDLPNHDEIAAGLELRDLYKPVAVALDAVAAADKKLGDARIELSHLELTARELPAKIRHGYRRADELPGALVKRDAQALVVGDCVKALAAARERVKAEETHAKKARDAEIARRRDALQAEADKLKEVLGALKGLDRRLAHEIDPMASSAGVGWPRSNGDDFLFVGAMNEVEAAAVRGKAAQR